VSGDFAGFDRDKLGRPLTPDRRFYWEGTSWRPTSISPDGRAYWDGAGWQPLPIAAPSYAAPPTLLQGYAPSATTGYVVAPKSPAVAVLLSLFFPGVGSLVSGSQTTGTIILIGWLVSIPLMFVCVGFFTYFGFWVWGLFDAYNAAQSWNRAHGILS
jgi:TM2 domain-containing membrane protein YozV